MIKISNAALIEENYWMNAMHSAHEPHESVTTFGKTFIWIMGVSTLKMVVSYYSITHSNI